MATIDIARAQLATLFGSALTSITLVSYTNPSRSPAVTVDCRGKWCAWEGDDSGTPVLRAVGDSLAELETFIGPQGPRAVDEASNVGSYFICYIPENMG